MKLLPTYSFGSVEMYGVTIVFLMGMTEYMLDYEAFEITGDNASIHFTQIGKGELTRILRETT